MSKTRHVVQVSEAAWERHGAALASEHPDLSWLVVGTDTLLLDGSEVTPEQAAPTIAWFGYDGLRSDATRRHFSLAKRAESLQLALTSYAGLDGSLWSGFAASGVTVTHGHLSGVPISQFVMARVLEWYHRPQQLAATRTDRRWVGQTYREIENSTWVVVGLGHIGTNIALRAKAFGAHVIGVRRLIDGTEAVDEIATPDKMAELVPRADVLVFAVPESNATRDLVDAGLLSKLKPSTVLVNVGRGTLIVEQDLIEALDTGRPEVAILDVTRTEPLPDDSPLWTHPKVMLSPHTSASGSNRHARSKELFSANVRRFLNGEVLPDTYR